MSAEEAARRNARDLLTTRHCFHCKVKKPWAEFPNQNNSPAGRIYKAFICNLCKNTMISDYRHKKKNTNPESVSLQNRRLYYKRHYGLSPEEISEMIKRQNGACFICEKPLHKPHVDHCHTTGIIRKILCTTCNIGLGSFFDSPILLRAAANYVEKHAASSDQALSSGHAELFQVVKA